MVLLLLVASCGVAESVSDTSAAQSIDDSSEEGVWNPQGSELQAARPQFEGFYVDTGGGWALAGVPLHDVAVVDGELVAVADHPLAGAELVGATFVATAPDATHLEMQIAAVVHHENVWNSPPESGERHDYILEYRQPTGAWVGLCSGDPPGATLVPGSFGLNASHTSSGNYDPSPARLTFSCHEGVAAKCIDWGYAPWANAGAMVPFFQACTRMARADYCGTGRSLTVDGTMINYGDLGTPPVVEFHPLDGFLPEAVWGLGNGIGLQPAVLCLSRLRWSTIPLGTRGPCAELLPDPREQPGIGYCDDLTIAEWAARGALFINNSRMMDTGLYVWTDGAGHYMTTSRYPWLGSDGGASGPPGYPTFVSIEGSAYKPTLMPPAKPGILPLYRCTKVVAGTTLHLTTTDPAPGNGWTDCTLEAYVFGPSSDPPTSTAQRLYLHGDGHGAYTSTTQLVPPAGYTNVAVLGWLPR